MKAQMFMTLALNFLLKDILHIKIDNMVIIGFINRFLFVITSINLDWMIAQLCFPHCRQGKKRNPFLQSLRLYQPT